MLNKLLSSRRNQESTMAICTQPRLRRLSPRLSNNHTSCQITMRKLLLSQGSSTWHISVCAAWAMLPRMCMFRLVCTATHTHTCTTHNVTHAHMKMCMYLNIHRYALTLAFSLACHNTYARNTGANGVIETYIAAPPRAAASHSGMKYGTGSSREGYVH